MGKIKDFHLSELLHHAKESLHLLCNYVQTNTPYGDEYKEAFKAIQEVQSDLANLEIPLAKCDTLMRAKRGF